MAEQVSQPWEADYGLDAVQAQTLIQEQFPELAEKVEYFGEGWDNTAFLAQDEWVFRFPRRKEALFWLEQELNALPKLQGKLPLPVPNPVYKGIATPRFPFPFAGYALLNGTTADRARLTEKQRTDLAQPLGEFLKCLHRTQLPKLSTDSMGRFDFEQRIRQGSERLDALQEVIGPEHILLRKKLHSWSGPADLPAVTVHGDLYSRHLLVDEKAQLSGVIDWGDVHQGWASTDLALVPAFLPKSAHSAFISSYGEISADTWRLACFRALSHNLGAGFYAKEVGDESLLQECLESLKRLASLPF